MLYDARDLFAARDTNFDTLQIGGRSRGLMSALYLIIAKERPTREAMGQLAWKYGHVKAAKTGLINAFFILSTVRRSGHGIF